MRLEAGATAPLHLQVPGSPAGSARLRAEARLADRSPLRPFADHPLALWREVAAGRWFLADRFEADGRGFVIFQASPRQASTGRASPGRALTARERAIVEQTARGRSNKQIGFDLGIAGSSASSHLSSALRRLGLTHRVDLVALLPVITGRARARRFEVRGASFAVASCPAGSRALAALGAAERDVAIALIAGRSNEAIAALRGTAVRTVANQVARVFRKLGVGSRAQLAVRVEWDLSACVD